jgi:hypothetical protein
MMKICKVWFENDRIYVLTDDGRTMWQSLLYYRRLREATDEQRADCEIDDEGIHWERLDEDVSLESFEYDNPEPEGVSRLFLTHPELNESAIARRLGIDRNVMRQYVSGMSKPSPVTEQLIFNEVRRVGSELASVKL